MKKSEETPEEVASSSSSQNLVFPENIKPCHSCNSLKKLTFEAKILKETDNALVVTVVWREKILQGTLLQVGTTDDNTNVWECPRLQNHPSCLKKQKPKTSKRKTRKKWTRKKQIPKKQSTFSEKSDNTNSWELPKQHNPPRRLKQRPKTSKRETPKKGTPEEQKPEEQTPKNHSTFTEKNFPEAFVNRANILTSKLRFGRNRRVAPDPSSDSDCLIPSDSNSDLVIDSDSRPNEDLANTDRSNKSSLNQIQPSTSTSDNP